MISCALETVAQTPYLYEAEALAPEHAEDHMGCSIWSGLRALCGEKADTRSWARALPVQ